MLNYLRYFIVAILFGSLLYTYTINIGEEMILSSIDKKIPLKINKKGFNVKINSFEINDITENIVTTTMIGTIKMDDSNKIKKSIQAHEGGFFTKLFKEKLKVNDYLNKEVSFDIFTKAVPQLDGSELYFKVLSIDANNVIKIQRLNSILQNRIEKIKIPIKKLEDLSWLFSTKDINFQDNGDLIINVVLSKLIIFLLIPLFLLREIGLFLIVLYQKFLSPRKGYKCAKGHLHGNGTCSSTTKDAFRKDGFIGGIKEYRKSTKECREAYTTIQSKRRVDKIDAAICAGCDGSPSAFGSEAGLLSTESSFCDVGGCDVGGCDVGGCDVGGCDVGGC